MDAILSLRLHSEVHREFSQPLHVIYVDLKAAFDSLDRDLMWKALQGIGTPQKILDLLRELHTSTSSRVKNSSKLSSHFPLPQEYDRAVCWLRHCSAPPLTG